MAKAARKDARAMDRKTLYRGSTTLDPMEPPGVAYSPDTASAAVSDRLRPKRAVISTEGDSYRLRSHYARAACRVFTS